MWDIRLSLTLSLSLRLSLTLTLTLTPTRWDQMWRATTNYGRKGLPLQAISQPNPNPDPNPTLTLPLPLPLTLSLTRPSRPSTSRCGICWASCAGSRSTP